MLFNVKLFYVLNYKIIFIFLRISSPHIRYSFQYSITQDSICVLQTIEIS